MTIIPISSVKVTVESVSAAFPCNEIVHLETVGELDRVEELEQRELTKKKSHEIGHPAFT